MAHWIDNDEHRKKFWAKVKNEIGLTEDEAHEALGIESVRDWGGTGAEAIARLREWQALREAEARRQEEARLTGTVSSLPEAPALAWTRFVTPPGFEWSYTARAGLDSDLAALARDLIAQEIAAFEALAQENGWRPANSSAPSRSRPQPLAKPRPQPQQATEPRPQPAGNAGPPPPPPPPPPTGQDSNAPPAEVQPGDNGHNVEMTEFVKITAPSGKPVIEFWRPNRQYRELYWSLGGEAFLNVAPKLVEKGWTAEHFEAVGEEYQLPLKIEWVPSPKNPKWKDIVSVEPR